MNDFFSSSSARCGVSVVFGVETQIIAKLTTWMRHVKEKRGEIFIMFGRLSVSRGSSAWQKTYFLVRRCHPFTT